MGEDKDSGEADSTTERLVVAALDQFFCRFAL